MGTYGEYAAARLSRRSTAWVGNMRGGQCFLVGEWAGGRENQVYMVSVADPLLPSCC
jgi:hypothetical protein